MESRRAALVSTAQGEEISGEENLREELGMLYGNVNGSEQRPTASQLSGTAVLAKNLDSRHGAFESSLKGLTPLNQELERRKLDPLRPLTEEGCQKKSAV